MGTFSEISTHAPITAIQHRRRRRKRGGATITTRTTLPPRSSRIHGRPPHGGHVVATVSDPPGTQPRLLYPADASLHDPEIRPALDRLRNQDRMPVPLLGRPST
jgi:hypothetical protein